MSSPPVSGLWTVRSASLLPTVVCFVSLALLRRAGELYGRQRTVFEVWFALSLVVELIGRQRSLGLWMAGFLGQAALAVVLLLKQRIDDIY